MSTKKSYTSAADIQDYVLSNIAPNYFDFSKVNNYRAGIFGFVNEVISTITMDTHNAINIARRESYPVSALYPKSYYKMAALQNIGLPTATPGKCDAILILDRDEIRENSTYKNGVYTCIIDKTVQIMADNKPLSLLYPIIITSNEVGGVWTYTTHYDKSIKNDIDKHPELNYYITNKTFNADGKRYLFLSVILYQCAREYKSEIVSIDNMISTTSLLFKFEGKLANFEVFYIKEPGESKAIQLNKLLSGQSMTEKPFCYYRMVNDNQLEISFPKNIYFTPELNSEIQLEIFTSMGNDGNFDSFKGDLACTTDSENYPYNNNMTILGKVIGSCKLGENAPDNDVYQSNIRAVYCTNNTITTSHDLQVVFDQMTASSNKVVFRKKRHDSFDRTYGAYVLLKDSKKNIIPSNTLSIKLNLSQFDTYNDSTTTSVIKPGTLFEYDENSYDQPILTGKKNNDLILTDDLSMWDNSTERFIYTNPFLIMCTMNPNLVGYYINSMDETMSIECSFINDSCVTQFIGSKLTIKRNAINGENFYKISISISPTSDLNPDDIIVQPSEDEFDYYIRAEHNGILQSIKYDSDQNCVIATLLYDNGETDEIQLSSFIDKTSDVDNNTFNDENDDEDDVEILPGDSSSDNYVVHSGYTLKIEVYDNFLEGDIIAVKNVRDKGRIRAALDIGNVLYENGRYIPMLIEDYDEENNIYTLSSYISTDDILDENDMILINDGIYDIYGSEIEDVSIKYKNLRFYVNIFYKNNDINFSNKYTKFDYFKSHSLMNTYMENSENGVNLINHIDYIRSTLLFNESDISDNEDEDLDEDISMTIKEVPLIKANWIKNTINFKQVINSIANDYDTLQTMYYDLENNYGFDLKFYNTYGKSKFYKAGLHHNWQPLSRVNCSFKFGIYLSIITSQELFLNKFRTYVKEAVESINSMSSNQQSIYILNLTNEIMRKFPEIGYIEYYGFNDFNENTQKIEPIPKTELSEELLRNYIPEFINIATHIENGEVVPNIEIELLNSTNDIE